MPTRDRFRWMTVTAAVAVAAPAAALVVAAGPPRSLEELDAAFRETAASIARRAEVAGSGELAAVVNAWELPAESGRQFVIAIPPTPPGDAPPAWLDTAAERALWEEFLEARRRRAAGTFAVAIAATEPRSPTRRTPPQPEGGGVADTMPMGTAEAIRLLARTLRDDPGHERARQAAGWVRRGGQWVWPEVARHLDKGEEFSAAFGWLPAGRLKRYEAGERYVGGRWQKAGGPQPARQPQRRPAGGAAVELERIGWKFSSDHWQITTDAPAEAAATLAAGLEECHTAWWQVFGGFAHEPEEWNRRLEGRSHPKGLDPFVAKLTARREDYIAALEPLDPTVSRSLGTYWTPTRTAWFFAGEGQEPTTVYHEAVHQLFAETRRTSPLAGERCGFWAIEAVACYLESIEPAPWGWTVGGREAGRAAAARERLIEDGFYVSLEELCGKDRRSFQSDDRLPMLYSQISGLADFFMNGQRGRYRDAFVEYLVRIYTGTVDPDTLARLCRRDYADLDDEYRRHMAR